MTWDMMYTLTPHLLPASTFCVEMVGVHDRSDSAKASGKIWSPLAHHVAVEYVRSAEKPTLRGLKATLASKGVSELPEESQLSNWLKRCRRCKDLNDVPAMPEPSRVETTRLVLDTWLKKVASRGSLRSFPSIRDMH